MESGVFFVGSGLMNDCSVLAAFLHSYRKTEYYDVIFDKAILTCSKLSGKGLFIVQSFRGLIVEKQAETIQVTLLRNEARCISLSHFCFSTRDL